MNRVAYHKAIRSPNARMKKGRTPFSGTEDIAHAADGVQQLLLERAVDLLAQPADQDVDDVGLRVEVVLPDVRQDHRLRDHPAGAAHQVLEEGELSWTEIDGCPPARHAPGE